MHLVRVRLIFYAAEHTIRDSQYANSGRHPSTRCGVSMCYSKVLLSKSFRKPLNVTSAESRLLLWHPKSRLSPSGKKKKGSHFIWILSFFSVTSL